MLAIDPGTVQLPLRCTGEPVQVSGALQGPMLASARGGRQGRRPLQLYGKYTTTFLKVRPHKGDYQYANHNF